MQRMIEDLINGNLRDAKRQAKGKAMRAIAAYCVSVLGWKPERAAKAAYYLKNPSNATWQAYCDVEAKGKE